ncbi:nucleotide-binding universal stress UspA family protein [Mumia flava]|uniref:Nucleotide-binding universal stress UspA family protein n=1 Tax=Mumia flava TaxID=1348852 RepID=A0A0B2B795_9ACTN|nr:universal stress protein [Mumia flava]PJJ57880.1 nucleotide-binding universal stress UspA family protein [Mumia flava]
MADTPERIGTIVVGTDGSAGAERALHWAIEEASLRGTALQVVVAVDPSGSSVTSADDGETVAETVRAQARRIDPEAEVSVGVHEGAPVDVLLSVAAGAQLLVVGSHGTSSIRHNALGSVSDVLARVSPCPVVILPMGAA